MSDNADWGAVISLDLHFAVTTFYDAYGSDPVRIGLLPFETGVREMDKARLVSSDVAGNGVCGRAFIAPINSITILDVFGFGGIVAESCVWFECTSPCKVNSVPTKFGGQVGGRRQRGNCGHVY